MGHSPQGCKESDTTECFCPSPLWINKKLDLGFQGDCTSTIGHRLARVCSVTKLCPTFCSSVHGVVQARILEWGAISSSRGSSQLRDQTLISCVSCISRCNSLPLSHLRSPLGLKLLFSADREVEPALPAQRQPELLHRALAAPAPGQLPVPAQLLLQR